MLQFKVYDEENEFIESEDEREVGAEHEAPDSSSQSGHDTDSGEVCFDGSTAYTSLAQHMFEIGGYLLQSSRDTVVFWDRGKRRLHLLPRRRSQARRKRKRAPTLRKLKGTLSLQRRSRCLWTRSERRPGCHGQASRYLHSGIRWCYELTILSSPV